MRSPYPTLSAFYFPNYHRTRRGKAIFLALASGLLLSSATDAEVLFEDQFGSAMSSQDTTHDFNTELQSRQSGPLAPAPYSTNGVEWQTAINRTGKGMSCRLYFSNAWLGTSPSWELKEEDGCYSLAVDLSFMGLEQNNSLQALVALGRAEPAESKPQALDLAGVFGILISTGDEPLLRVRHNGDEVASVPFSPARENNLNLVLKWTQQGMEIGDMEILIDGAKIPVGPWEKFKLDSRRIMIGGIGKLSGYSGEGDPIPAMELKQLTYSKE